MENHFTESGEATFSALGLLAHFRKSLHRISRELLHSGKKPFDSRRMILFENPLHRALPNTPIQTLRTFIEARS
jgi:hypothetical protein